MKTFPPIRGIATVLALVCAGGLAQAEGPYQRPGDDNRGGIGSVCTGYYPIFATGSACYGSNVGHRLELNGRVNCCLARPNPRDPERVHPRSLEVRNQRIAAGLQAAGVMVQILGILIDMVESSSPSPEAEGEEIRARERGERLDAKRRAAAWAASGLRHLKAGDETSAAAHFGAAAEEAGNARDDDARMVYLRNMYLARAQKDLKLGLEALGIGEKHRANERFKSALYYAKLAKSDELSRRISAYIVANPTKPLSKLPREKPKESCLEVNGKLMCD